MTNTIARCAILIATLAVQAPAQRATPQLDVTSGIDTTDTVAHHLIETLKGYLASEGAGWKPTPYWRAAEQREGEQYDPASGILGYQLPGTIVQLSPDVPHDSTYVLKVLFALTDSARARWQPLALQRFYVVRQDTSWVLTSALRRHTAGWTVTAVGPLSYRYDPQYPFSIERARSAAAFVDSLVKALELPPPDTIRYYLAESADEMARLLGFDWLKLPSGPESGRGGWAGASSLYSGDDRRGEDYRHELAHLIAGPLRSSTGRHRFIEEGFATWLGGTAGLSLAAGIPRLTAFVREYPSYPWRDLASYSTPDDIRHLSGALLFEAVHREAGWPGVRMLLEAGRSDDALLSALPPALRMTPETFERWWRSEIARASAQEPARAQAVPEARAHHQLVYHAGDTRTYLIGGSTRRGEGHHYFDDMWYWDGKAWTQTEGLPFPRSSHRVIYHAQRNSLILFGGGFAQAVRAEGVIWEWRAGAWKAIGGNFRAGADEPEMCYDRKRQRVVIFGGWDRGGNFRGDTWEWGSEGLAPVDSAGPGPRAGHAFLYDPVRERCLLFGGQGPGGYHADTWEWDGVRWRQLEVSGPSARWFFGSATDLTNGRIIVFGGRGPDAPAQGRDAAGDFGDTWAWDGQRWEQLQITGPPPRSGAKLAFTGDSIVLFGGREERADAFHDRNDLWELQGRSWIQRH
jgi:hypothetical protein